MSFNDRVWSMDINGVPYIQDQVGLRQFRVVFDVDVMVGNALAFADIRIYNLVKDSPIYQGDSIVFRAGRTDAVDTVFIGVVINIFLERDGPNIITRLLCKSGEKTDRRGTIGSSYGKGSKITDVLRDLARAWPIPLDIDDTQFIDSPLFTSGYVANGDIPTVLFDLGYAGAFDFDWTVERGRLSVNRRGFSRSTTPTLVNQLTGMQGIPETTLGPDGFGVFVSVKLNPYFRINGLITIRSEFSTFNTGNMYVSEVKENVSANGDYSILSLRHRGDSHGNLWSTEIDALRVGTKKPPVNATTQENGTLVWGARVDQAFRVRVRQMGDNLNINPDWLMAVMGVETGYTFDPTEQNRAGSGATGLIQFTRDTAADLGTSTTALRRMTAVQQLDWVEEYYLKYGYASRVVNVGDCYMAVLNPIAIRRPDSYVMWTQADNPTKYTQNSGLDINRDFTITRGEAVNTVNKSMSLGENHRM